jgi:ribosomal protein S16
MDRLTHWQGQGAQVSDTVARLVRRFTKSMQGAQVGQA